MKDMEYLFDYDVKNLNLDVILNLKIEEKIFLLHEKKYISNLINIEVKNNELHLSSNIIKEKDGLIREVNEDDIVDIFVFDFSDDLSLVTKKEILIMLAFEMYKLYNIETFKDNENLIILENSLKNIFDEYYKDFILLYTLYFGIGKLNPHW